MSRQKRAQVAQQTVEILDRGTYTSADGREVSLVDSLAAARSSTRLYTPDQLQSLVEELPAAEGETTFSVANETTLAAARRFAEADPQQDVLCLNFASAKNPGGGFLGGSQAQEESLARASGLYACIDPVREYYETNRGYGSSIYTDHMIYSPRVPVFRDDDDELLARPYLATMLTAPAVNAGAVQKNEPDRVRLIEPTMLRRIEQVLAVARAHGHNTLVLGAWGCGVFRNDPASVARWFAQQLRENTRFQNAFRHVHFAVLDHSQTLATYEAFRNTFQ